VGNSGIIYQDADASFVKYFLENRFYTVLTRYVARVSLRVTASCCDFVYDALGSFAVEVHDADSGPMRSELLRDGPSNAARATCDYCHPAVQAKTIGIAVQKKPSS
jgi:hypothetical protein